MGPQGLRSSVYNVGMNVQCIRPGLFEFAWGEKIYRLCFLSSRAFRIFEAGRTDSACVLSVDARPSAWAKELPCGLSFMEDDLEVFLEPDGAVRANLKGQPVLNAHVYLPINHEAEESIAEKEGHFFAGPVVSLQGLAIENQGPVYGLGERTGPLDKRGYEYINWNTDDPSAHVDTFPSLYQSIPFLLLFRQERSVGVFFDNSSKMRFDINKSKKDEVLLEYSEGYFDCFFFFGTMPEVLSSYTALSGRQPLVPYWALGAQQCRWSYENKDKVEAVIRGYEEADIPLSCVYLDIDYMVDYMDFTVDEAKFPNVSEWLHGLLDKQIHIVPILDAGVKVLEDYDVYEEGRLSHYFCEREGRVYHNEVWPGDSVFPAFLDRKVQKWWATHVERMLNLGFAGIWNDMNEPASFDGPFPMDVNMGANTPHSSARNIYGHFMCKAGAEGFALANRRLFQLTRAGYAGTCRYSGSWAGDNQSIYDHLRLMFPQLMNMSLSGQTYVGVDIGGFGGDTTPELLTKWVTAAILNPLFRNHSAYGTKDQEPYLLEGKCIDAYRKAVMARYEILPALYTELFLAEKQGRPAIRPLVYNYPDDPNVINENTEMMLGEDLLIAPSFFPGETHRAVYFPEDFIHYETLKEYPKGYHIVDVSIGEVPLFLRKASMIVLAEKGNKKAEPPQTIRLYWNGNDARALFYEDAGDGREYMEGKYNLYELYSQHGKLHVREVQKGLKPRCNKVVVFDASGKETTYSLEELLDPKRP